MLRSRITLVALLVVGLAGLSVLDARAGDVKKGATYKTPQAARRLRKTTSRALSAIPREPAGAASPRAAASSPAWAGRERQG